VWDLSKDPQQQIDTLLDKETLSKFKKNKLKDFTGDQKNLLHWGIQALKFVERVETDLLEAHQSGLRCTNCTLFLLNSLETLDQWVEFETLDVSA
jgi:ferredoxin